MNALGNIDMLRYEAFAFEENNNFRKKGNGPNFFSIQASDVTTLTLRVLLSNQVTSATPVMG